MNRSRHFVPLLLSMTLVTGFVDAVSYLGLGKVFVANMTGNVVLLGFALAGAAGLSIAASLLALAAFLVGSATGGGLARRSGHHRGHHLALASAGSAVLLFIAAFTGSIGGVGSSTRDMIVVVLGLAMGLQNATARALAVPDLTTTVLTLTLTGIAADARNGDFPRLLRRLAAVVLMLVGAVLGGLLVVHHHAATSLWCATGLMAAIFTVTTWLAHGTVAEDWAKA